MRRYGYVLHLQGHHWESDLDWHVLETKGGVASAASGKPAPRSYWASSSHTARSAVKLAVLFLGEELPLEPYA